MMREDHAENGDDIRDISELNERFRGASAGDVIEWAVRFGERAGGGSLVSTNFRPYEAVILDLVELRGGGGVPVVWIDHGHNREATYAFAERLRELLSLDIRKYGPLEPIEVPGAAFKPESEQTADDDAAIHDFSEKVKLEPFRRALSELRPSVWFTALRKVQNPNRANLDVFEEGPNGILKVNPLFHWTDADMEAYLAERSLPNEWDYFDPAKAGEKRECGLHTRMK